MIAYCAHITHTSIFSNIAGISTYSSSKTDSEAVNQDLEALLTLRRAVDLKDNIWGFRDCLSARLDQLDTSW
jgi:hypothetical protein